ncbi:MAG: NUDIX hydrolase [Actinomycetota bacterium]
MKTKTAKSAGGIVFDVAGRIALLRTNDAEGSPRWSLPKGALEKGETVQEAAIREVLEETGLEADIIGEAGVIDYWFVWKPDDARYHKFVHYFVMRATGGDFANRDAEAEEVAWFEAEDAIQTCSFANERAMIRKAVASFRD